MSHKNFQTCIEACYQCAAESDHCAVACTQEDNAGQLAKCIELDLYCAEICRTAGSFMAKGEQFASRICSLCADICEACADECEKHHHDHCQRCAAACRRCAEECREMAEGTTAYR